jgi:hypothetical protein
MKKVFVFAISLLATCQFLFAQKEMIPAITEFIKQHKYQQANRYLDSVLKLNPKNVDALMMKGNVVLNCALDTTKRMQFVTADDATVFNTKLGEKPKLLSKKTVYQVEKIWRKCLAIDSTRADIRKGLCTIYSMALMKDSTKNEIVRLQKTEADEDGQQAFRMCEYARKFKERNRYDDAMEIYLFIAAQYPAVAGVRCDIASEYFYGGKINEALLWLDSCYRHKTVDETSFLNGAFTYSLLGFYDDAQGALNAYSRIYKRNMASYYYGLMLFSDSSNKYYTILNDFCQTVDSNSYTSEYNLARRLLAYRDTFTLNDYQTLIDDQEIPDYYKGLIHQRAFKQFRTTCEPFVRYGILQSSVKNYSAAVQLLEEGEHCQMKAEQAEYWMLHYAYALYMFGQKEKALVYFKPLTKSDKPFTAQSAKYFSAKILNEQKKVEEAKKLLSEIVLAKQTTKYVELAKQGLK